jgi:ubiquinone/menaquinone biosynthesis C-methylase UbiE
MCGSRSSREEEQISVRAAKNFRGLMAWSLSYGERVYGWWGRHPLVYKALMKFVTFGRENQLRRHTVESLNLSEGDTVLDLACGSGANFGLLRQAVGESGRVVGVDYSESMLSAARNRAERGGWENVELVRADAARNVFRDDSFDGAVCTMSMSAIPDHESATRNARRSLKPNARLAVMDSADFGGVMRVLNPLVHLVFKYTTNWDYRKDVVGSLEDEFGDGNVEVEWYNSRSMYVAVAKREVENY